jgi:hypothetical protein
MRAALHVDAAHSAPCAEERANQHGKTEPRHKHDAENGVLLRLPGLRIPAYPAPGLGSGPAELAGLHYDEATFLLSGRRRGPSPVLPDPRH